ncbi:sugar phosphate isomerase/epimerase [Candidatus Sumerlaeota bacterium]|nr:sugar phosphate isomerase/epimerase [Candidatus Sumerlaeota bacterium]
MASKVAAQLYTVRDFLKTAKDFEETLKKLAAMGYPAVQLSAVACMNGENPEVSAADARALLDKYGLKCAATHRGRPNFVERLDDEIAFHKTLGCDYTAIGNLGVKDKSPGSYRQLIEESKVFLPKLKEHGIRWGFHNHGFDYAKYDGRPNMDILIKEAPADFMMEIDTYWVTDAGANPETVLKACKGRIPVVHFKDMAFDPEKKRVMAPVGEGNLDWDGIIAVCEADNVEWYCVEQDDCYDRDPFECLESSLHFLESKGL